MIPLAEALTLITRRLAAAGIETPRREARLLLAAALQVSAAGLLLQDSVEPARFEPFLARRTAREPLAYITGHREFWGLNFAVSPATLIPRPDSETLIEAALATCPPGITRILDLGTGTGCLLLAALTEFPAAWGIGTDISPAAAALAAHNAKILNLAPRTSFLAASWAAPLHQTFDLILSNPPYIPAADLTKLMPEVQDFEPQSALDGGPDGLNAYRSIIAGLPALLAPQAVAILELGINQAPAAAALAGTYGLSVEIRQDLQKIDRAMILRRK